MFAISGASMAFSDMTSFSRLMHCPMYGAYECLKRKIDPDPDDT